MDPYNTTRALNSIIEIINIKGCFKPELHKQTAQPDVVEGDFWMIVPRNKILCTNIYFRFFNLFKNTSQILVSDIIYRSPDILVYSSEGPGPFGENLITFGEKHVEDKIIFFGLTINRIFSSLSLLTMYNKNKKFIEEYFNEKKVQTNSKATMRMELIKVNSQRYFWILIFKNMEISLINEIFVVHKLVPELLFSEEKLIDFPFFE